MFNPVYRSRQKISGGQWQLYPVGVVTIPPIRVTSGLLISNASIGVQAERLIGNGGLDLDCFVLIPTDDGAVHVDIGEHTTSNLYPIRVSQNADGTVRSFKTSPTYVEGSSIVEPINYTGLIANSSKPYVIVAGQDWYLTLPDGTIKKENIFSKKIDVAYAYIPRWRTLRGTVT
jgi:hypothetical protein